MTERADLGGGATSSADEYADFVRLDELESLLEDLEDELGANTQAIPKLSDGLQQRMKNAGVHEAETLRNKIAELHAQLDQTC